MCIKAFSPVRWTFLQLMDSQTDRQIKQLITVAHMWETQTGRQTDSQPLVKCTDVVLSHELLELPAAKMATACCSALISAKWEVFFSSANKEKEMLHNRKQATETNQMNKGKQKKSQHVKLKGLSVRGNDIRGNFNTQWTDKDWNFHSTGCLFQKYGFICARSSRQAKK